MKVIFFTNFLLKGLLHIENAQVKGPYQDVTGLEHVHPAVIGRAFLDLASSCKLIVVCDGSRTE